MFLAEETESKIFLLQDINLIDKDSDQNTNVNDDNVDTMEGQLNEGLNDIELSNEEVPKHETVNEDEEGIKENENENVQENTEISHENEEVNQENEESTHENGESTQEITTNLDENNQVEIHSPEYETIKTKELDDDDVSLNQEEISSQLSEDQEESTVINNDSAYETIEMNSQNGSESRLQSVDTNGGDVDNENGENFQLQSEIENFDQRQMEKYEIERLENDLENPPTPVDEDDYDVVVSAVNLNKTEESTEDVGKVH